MGGQTHKHKKTYELMYKVGACRSSWNQANAFLDQKVLAAQPFKKRENNNAFMTISGEGMQRFASISSYSPSMIFVKLSYPLVVDFAQKR